MYVRNGEHIVHAIHTNVCPSNATEITVVFSLQQKSASSSELSLYEITKQTLGKSL